jgi:DNA recombination protein RmuC
MESLMPITDILLIVILVLVTAGVILLLVLLFRKVGIDLKPIEQALQSSERFYERTERSVKEEIARNREEASNASRQSREEMANTLKGVGDSMQRQLLGLTQTNDQKFERLRETVEKRLGVIQEESGRKLDQMRQESVTSAQKAREEVTGSLKEFSETLIRRLSEVGQSNQQILDGLRSVVEERLRTIQEDNSRQLEQMRATVDEKLQGTLEKRLSESFKQVSERLEQVHKGLGEMQNLATGVGDLKKVLTNVKTRGTWGEVQLGAMLEQILTPEQYELNVDAKGSGERVEFAVRLPGRGEDRDEIVWLPIDAKFPVEDYQRLVDAQEKADLEGVEAAGKQLENRVRNCARDICEKYLSPPKTTDFGILFLPIEGLFAEVIRRAGLTEVIQRECRVVIAGPTTLWSILNSLQMGFKTLAIQKRSSEVWNLLAAVKTDWTKYGEILEKVQKKLHEASETIEKAQQRTRVIGRKLNTVEELPAAEAAALLPPHATEDDAEAAEDDAVRGE